jgi:hypothetical protein
VNAAHAYIMINARSVRRYKDSGVHKPVYDHDESLGQLSALALGGLVGV